MITEERVIAQIAEANPVRDPKTPTTQERAEAERILRRVLDDGTAAPRRGRSLPRLGMLAPVASLIVVVAVAAVVLRTGGTSTSGSTTSNGLQITLTAQPTPQTPRVTASAMSREIALMHRRLRSVGSGVTVRQSGASGIVVTIAKARTSEDQRILDLITQPAQLRFYDWEANVLTPNGKTAASQLPTQDRTAMSLSQGGAQGAGMPGAGSMSLYDAVTLAASQPKAPASRFLSRHGPEYYMFGAPGSSACAAWARQMGASTTPPGHCLLAGPVSPAPSISRARAVGELAAELPPGVTASEGQVLVVAQGTIVVQAGQHNAAPVPFASPAAQFFVLRDNVALTGNDITHPQASTDQSGLPDVTFRFTPLGRSAFESVTKAITHRGVNVSLAGVTLEQHFAVVLDHQLLTIPQIDYRQYPDGIIDATGADVTGGLTRQSAKDLAAQLRYGALPLALRVVP